MNTRHACPHCQPRRPRQTRPQVGDRIRAARSASAMSQTDLAVAIFQQTDGQISFGRLMNTRISEWERNVKPVPGDILPHLCAVLGLNQATMTTAPQPAPAPVLAPVQRRGMTYADVR